MNDSRDSQERPADATVDVTPDVSSTREFSPEERRFAMWTHISALTGLFVPCGNVAGPLILWLIQKDSMPLVREEGIKALNFQVSVTIYNFILGICAGVISFLFCGLGIIFTPIIFVLYCGSMIYAVIAGVKVNDGKESRYPFAMQLFR